MIQVNSSLCLHFINERNMSVTSTGQASRNQVWGGHRKRGAEKKGKCKVNEWGRKKGAGRKWNEDAK